MYAFRKCFGVRIVETFNITVPAPFGRKKTAPWGAVIV